ncbi:MAG TPA: hypothetical protein VJB70_05250 [Candidatus Paceibacterota bacterium]
MEIFGFVVPMGPWDLAAYFAFLLTTVGVFWKKHGGLLMTVSAFILILSAWFGLHNALLATLQSLVFVAGVFQVTKLQKNAAAFALIMLTIIAFYGLLKTNTITGLDSTSIGALGLVLLVFGLLLFPSKSAFYLNATACIPLLWYSYAVGAWVFVALNVVFFLANAYQIKNFISAQK